MSPYLQLLRPKQWIKNGFVIAPIFFAKQFDTIIAWQSALIAAAAFVLASCVIYIINDLRDADEDRKHPIKCLRPLAARLLRPAHALIFALLCAVACAGLLTLLPIGCAGIISLYIALNILYTYWLKHKALLDVFFIASCYVLRVLMGCYALGVVVSPWIILTSFMLALFLGFGKRYNEMDLPGYVASKPNLQHYSRELLDKLVIICAGSALMAYAIYAAEIAIMSGDNAIIYTVGFVAFGLFRYLQSIYVYHQGGEPESVILKDKWQWLNLALWLISTMLILK